MQEDQSRGPHARPASFCAGVLGGGRENLILSDSVPAVSSLPGPGLACKNNRPI